MFTALGQSPHKHISLLCKFHPVAFKQKIIAHWHGVQSQNVCADFFMMMCLLVVVVLIVETCWWSIWKCMCSVFFCVFFCLFHFAITLVITILWLTFDEKLSFRDHIHDKIHKAYAMLGIIKRNFNYISINSFILLYKTMVRWLLDYCVSVWVPYK